MEGNNLELVDFFIDYLDAIDFEKTRLSYPSRPIVIFCGGEVFESNSILYEDVEAHNFKSFRECLKKASSTILSQLSFLHP